MAKKKATRSTTRSRRNSSHADQVGLDEAEERLRLAREELKQARQSYAAAKSKAAETSEELTEGSIAELVESGLNFVKKYPALGICAATAFGVFLGRLFRR